MKGWFALLLLLSFGTSWGQTIYNIEIIPSNPSDTDSIYLRTTVYSSNAPLMEIDYNVTDYGDSINVAGCYSTGLSDAGDSLIHIHNLGLISAGLYEINFTLYGTPDWDSCTYFFMEKDSIILNIGYNSMEDYSESKINIYPNPAAGGVINIQSCLSDEFYRIYNSLGQLVQEGKTEPTIDVSKLQEGLYYFVMEESATTKKLLIE